MRSIALTRVVGPCIAALVLLTLFTAATGGPPFHGNRSSHVFHDSSCKYYDCKNCTASFGTAEEAVAAGYRPCAICRPGTGSSAPQPKSESVVGNTQSHVFHRLSCRYSSCKNCTATFKSRQEAIDAGYRPGACCNP